MNGENKQSSFFYLLIIIICFLFYILYQKNQDNERMLKICQDQESVIKDLEKAISAQKFYINQLEYYRTYQYNYLKENNKNDPSITH